MALTFVIVALICYMYFLSASVVHVVIRKEINQEINTLSSNISVLESKYIEAQHSVSEDIASMHGYTLTKAKIFIEPAESTLVLSKNNDS